MDKSMYQVHKRLAEVYETGFTCSLNKCGRTGRASVLLTMEARMNSAIDEPTLQYRSIAQLEGRVYLRGVTLRT
jgi:hypothetical protein